MRYVILKTEELEALEKLQKNSTDNTVRKRSHCLLLSHQRRTITDLSGIFDVNRRTIERWLDSWAKNGLDSLPKILLFADEHMTDFLIDVFSPICRVPSMVWRPAECVWLSVNLVWRLRTDPVSVAELVWLPLTDFLSFAEFVWLFGDFFWRVAGNINKTGVVSQPL